MDFLYIFPQTHPFQSNRTLFNIFPTFSMLQSQFSSHFWWRISGFHGFPTQCPIESSWNPHGIFWIIFRAVESSNPEGLMNCHPYNVGPPSYKLVFAPITIVISTINHSEIGVINQLSYRLGAPLCTHPYPICWDPHWIPTSATSETPEMRPSETSSTGGMAPWGLGRARNRGYFFFSKMLVSASEKSTFSNMPGQCWTYFLESWVVEGHILSEILSSFSKMLPSSRVEDSQMNQQRLEAQNIINWSQNIRKPPFYGRFFACFSWGFPTTFCVSPHFYRNWSATGASRDSPGREPNHGRNQEPEPPSSDPQQAYFDQAVGLGWKFSGKKLRHHLVKIPIEKGNRKDRTW